MADGQATDKREVGGGPTDDPSPDVRGCADKLNKLTKELSDAVTVSDEERAELIEKIKSLEVAAASQGEVSRARHKIKADEARELISKLGQVQDAFEDQAAEIATHRRRIAALQARLIPTATDPPPAARHAKLTNGATPLEVAAAVRADERTELEKARAHAHCQ